MTTDSPAPTVWPCLNFKDARAAIRFLVDAFGFEEMLVVPGDSPEFIVHAELRWPPGGGVMLGSAGKDDSPFAAMPTGANSLYCITDEPDALFARATAAGGEVVQVLKDEEYGSRGFTVKDPEGNLWSFGTYRGTNPAS